MENFQFYEDSMYIDWNNFYLSFYEVKQHGIKQHHLWYIGVCRWIKGKMDESGVASNTTIKTLILKINLKTVDSSCIYYQQWISLVAFKNKLD